MNRPSHWILGSLAVLGGALWWTGALESYLSARPSGGGFRPSESTRRADPPVVVRRDTPPPRAAASNEVSGRVVDRLGFPVASASVRVAGERSEPVFTDSRGRFVLTVSGAIHKRLRIDAPGVHRAVEVLGSLDSVDVVLQDAVPWQSAAPPTVAALPPTGPQQSGLLFGEGAVRDAAGRWIADARVTVRETGATGRTDANGRYILPLAEGPCTLVAYDGQGGVAVSETYPIARRQGKEPLPELRLAPGPTLRGRLSGDEGEPLVDVSVVVETGGIRRVARTGQGGMFAVAGLVPGEADLTIFPHRGYLGDRISLVVERDASLPNIELQRPRQDPLRLTVFDRAGAVQPFVHVVADQLAGLCRAYGQADANGRVVLAGLADGDIEFEVRSPRLEPVRVDGFDAERHALIVAP